MMVVLFCSFLLSISAWRHVMFQSLGLVGRQSLDPLFWGSWAEKFGNRCSRPQSPPTTVNSVISPARSNNFIPLTQENNLKSGASYHARPLMWSTCWDAPVGLPILEKTSKALKTRISEHRSSIRNHDKPLDLLTQWASFTNMCVDLFLLGAKNICVLKITVGFMKRAYRPIFFSPPCIC